MRYVILRHRFGRSDDPFMEMAGAADSGVDFDFPFLAESQELTAVEAAELRHDPTVIELTPSIKFKLIEPFDEVAPSPPAGLTWGLEAVGAHSTSQDGGGVTVAILDTGIDCNHTAFSGVVFRADDLIDFTIDESGQYGTATDVHGHGTHVAGTIFGREVDGIRIGVAPGIDRVLIAKVLGPSGGTTEAVLNAIEWAVSKRADIISMSLGIDFPSVVTRMTESSYPIDIATSRALEAYRLNIRLFDRLAALLDARIARGQGALLVAAAGNESRRDRDPRYTVATSPPAAADGFISVGAVARGLPGNSAPFSVAPFSNTGCAISAPGVEILSADLGGGLGWKSGTSMAAPHVAGVMALWTQKLFPDGKRPAGWARDVQRAVEINVAGCPGVLRDDVGLGVVQAPQ